MIAGEDAIFEVEATGKPLPGFKWQLDTIELHGNDRIEMIPDGQGGAKLIIRDVRRTDSGLYFCIAHSKAGRSKCSATLRVRGKD